MKVKELIEKLQGMDGDMEVLMASTEYEDEHPMNDFDLELTQREKDKKPVLLL